MKNCASQFSEVLSATNKYPTFIATKKPCFFFHARQSYTVTLLLNAYYSTLTVGVAIQQSS